MYKVVIASDSFKGSLSSAEVAEAAAAGIRSIFPTCKTIQLTIADGGEGTALAVAEAGGGNAETVTVHDPLGRLIQSEYYIMKDGTAVMEMAAASGLTLLATSERNPLLTSTYGTGEMILDAFAKGCRRFIIGIGGSATNDGGTGMLEALGFRFMDICGRDIKGLCGGRTAEVARIDDSEVPKQLLESEFIVACDVTAPFCGPGGAADVYARQKGARTQEMITTLEAGMESLNEVIKATYGIDLKGIPGSGAAGGLGGAFVACLKGRLERGIDLVLDTIGFESIIKDADLIITGEGKIDNQTSQGKVVSGIVSRAKASGVPVIAIAGISELTESQIQESGLTGVFPIGPRPQNESDLANAMRPEVASKRISETVAKALEELSPSLFRGNL